MPIDPKKLAAFANKPAKKGGLPPAFGKKKGNPGFPPKPKKDHDDEHDEDEEDEHDHHDEHGEHDESEHDHGDKHIDVDQAADEVKGDHETMDWARGYDPEQDGNPPEWVADEAKWEKAKEAVDPEGDGADYDEPWAVVASVYEKMGGRKK